jgi:hypothetical protein
MPHGRRLWPLLLALAGIPILSAAADMPGMPNMAMHAAKHPTLTRVVGDYRIELHLLPPEQFYTAAEVSAQHISAGMLIVGGLPRVPVGATPAPNHHLIVHVFDRTSGKAVTDAKVQMSIRPVGADGHPNGPSRDVPVVTMQAIGAGAASTHYGNNLVIPAGDYMVSVIVNHTSTTARFPIRIES